MKKIIISKNGRVEYAGGDWNIQVADGTVCGSRGRVNFSFPYELGKRATVWLPEKDECHGDCRRFPTARVGLHRVPVSIQY